MGLKKKLKKQNKRIKHLESQVQFCKDIDMDPREILISLESAYNIYRADKFEYNAIKGTMAMIIILMIIIAFTLI